MTARSVDIVAPGFPRSAGTVLSGSPRPCLLTRIAWDKKDTEMDANAPKLDNVGKVLGRTDSRGGVKQGYNAGGNGDRGGRGGRSSPADKVHFGGVASSTPRAAGLVERQIPRPRASAAAQRQGYNAKGNGDRGTLPWTAQEGLSSRDNRGREQKGSWRGALATRQQKGAGGSETSLMVAWRCKECRVCFQTYDALVDHQQTLGHWNAKLDNCGRVFLTQSELDGDAPANEGERSPIRGITATACEFFDLAAGRSSLPDKVHVGGVASGTPRAAGLVERRPPRPRASAAADRQASAISTPSRSARSCATAAGRGEALVASAAPPSWVAVDTPEKTLAVVVSAADRGARGPDTQRHPGTKLFQRALQACFVEAGASVRGRAGAAA